jgi:hypothetical protein
MTAVTLKTQWNHWMVVFLMVENCEFRWLGMVARNHPMAAVLEDVLDQGIVVVVVVAVTAAVEGEVALERDATVEVVAAVVEVQQQEGPPADHALGQRPRAELIAIDQGPAPLHQNGQKGIQRRGVTGMADLETVIDPKKDRGPLDQSPDPDLRRQTTN